MSKNLKQFGSFSNAGNIGNIFSQRFGLLGRALMRQPAAPPENPPNPAALARHITQKDFIKSDGEFRVVGKNGCALENQEKIFFGATLEAGFRCLLVSAWSLHKEEPVWEAAFAILKSKKNTNTDISRIRSALAERGGHRHSIFVFSWVYAQANYANSIEDKLRCDAEPIIKGLGLKEDDYIFSSVSPVSPRSDVLWFPSTSRIYQMNGMEAVPVNAD